jgi:carbamoyl-phosphate synthase large subunit
MIKNRSVQLIINTPLGQSSKIDDSFIRMMAIQYKIPYMTTMPAASATVAGIRAAKQGNIQAKSLQEYQAGK